MIHFRKWNIQQRQKKLGYYNKNVYPWKYDMTSETYFDFELLGNIETIKIWSRSLFGEAWTFGYWPNGFEDVSFDPENSRFCKNRDVLSRFRWTV